MSATVTKVDEPSPVKGISYLGLTAQARILNTARYHLWNVLRGERRSPRLIRRYAALLNSRDQRG
jgi:hypothetical protein